MQKYQREDQPFMDDAIDIYRNATSFETRLTAGFARAWRRWYTDPRDSHRMGGLSYLMFNPKDYAIKLRSELRIMSLDIRAAHVRATAV